MFTGIIEETGKIVSVSRDRVQKIVIESGLEVHRGDSIAVQGICLTVTEIKKNLFTVDAMRQTRGVTTLSDWCAGNVVNLERALRIGDRLGGHIMLGHIDETGKLVRIKANEYSFQIKKENIDYVVPKGSIGIDGASLTIASINNNIFSVSLIPFTLNSTTLGKLRTGALVNIEYDYLAKLLKK
jgi:riboflavin synthase